VGDQQYLSWEVPMARRQSAGRPADRPVEHDPDGPLLVQMQLQLRNLQQSSNNSEHQLLRRRERRTQSTVGNAVFSSSRRSRATCGGSATRRSAGDPSASRGEPESLPSRERASSGPAGSAAIEFIHQQTAEELIGNVQPRRQHLWWSVEALLHDAMRRGAAMVARLQIPARRSTAHKQGKRKQA
jgi:hypothetical protein